MLCLSLSWLRRSSWALTPNMWRFQTFIAPCLFLALILVVVASQPFFGYNECLTGIALQGPCSHSFVLVAVVVDGL
ncbi:hypothetical protein V6N11_071881 [Hibiscus sabdariffa]|uniref:Uncharacterized protein n=1 Tax=Hibiscus sabdariffa TaxID=183260 RepID=A0ABR2U1D3_9ROSI